MGRALAAAVFVSSLAILAGCQTEERKTVRNTNWLSEGQRCATAGGTIPSGESRDVTTSLREDPDLRKHKAIATCIVNAAKKAKPPAGWIQRVKNVGYESREEIFWNDLLGLARDSAIQDIHLALLVLGTAVSAGPEETKADAREILRKWAEVGGTRTATEELEVTIARFRLDPEALAVDMAAGTAGRTVTRLIRGLNMGRRASPMLVGVGEQIGEKLAHDTAVNGYHGTFDEMFTTDYFANAALSGVPLGLKSDFHKNAALAVLARGLGIDHQGDLGGATMRFALGEITKGLPQPEGRTPKLERQYFPTTLPGTEQTTRGMILPQNVLPRQYALPGVADPRDKLLLDIIDRQNAASKAPSWTAPLITGSRGNVRPQAATPSAPLVVRPVESSDNAQCDSVLCGGMRARIPPPTSTGVKFHR